MINSSKKLGFVERLRYRLKAMLSLKCTPHQLALSSALGMLVGMSPYVGLQTYIGVGLSAFFKVPVYPIMIGVYITNPVTIPIIFTLTTKFGMWLLNIESVVKFEWAELNFDTVITAGKELIVPFIVGTHVIGLILSVPTYILVYLLASKYMNKNTEN